MVIDHHVVCWFNGEEFLQELGLVLSVIISWLKFAVATPFQARYFAPLGLHERFSHAFSKHSTLEVSRKA
jgi:hypothetical protein